jgi:hypothetical protein
MQCSWLIILPHFFPILKAGAGCRGALSISILTLWGMFFIQTVLNLTEEELEKWTEEFKGV